LTPLKFESGSAHAEHNVNFYASVKSMDPIMKSSKLTVPNFSTCRITITAQNATKLTEAHRAMFCRDGTPIKRASLNSKKWQRKEVKVMAPRLYRTGSG